MNAARETTRVLAPLRLEARALQRGGPGLRVIRSGVGPERSRRTCARLRGDVAERWVIAGLCGAVETDLEPGDVILASHLLDCDIALAQDPALESALRARGLRVRKAPMLCVPRLVQGDERARLRERGAAAVDMESRWLAPAAQGRPLHVIRVVMDGPRHELFRPATARNLLRGLRVLGDVGRGLEKWSVEETATRHAETRRAGGQ